MSSSAYSELSSRISSWRQEVASCSAYERQQTPRPIETTASPQSRPRPPLLPTSTNLRKQECVVAPQTKRPEPDKNPKDSTSLPPSTNPSKPKPDLREEGEEEALTPIKPRNTRKRCNMPDRGLDESIGLRRSARERKPTHKVRENQQRQEQGIAFRPKTTDTGPDKQSALPLIRSGSPAPITGHSLSATMSKLPGDPTIFHSNQRLPPSDSIGLSNADGVDRPFSSPDKSASINISDWERLNPVVRFMEVGDVLDVMGTLPKPVALLRERLLDRSGYIPHVLKSTYDLSDLYQTTFANDLRDATCLKMTVDCVRDTAASNHKRIVSENQWGSTTIQPILFAVFILHHDATHFVNLEPCSIQPIDLRPRRLGGESVDLEAESTASNTNQTTLTTLCIINYGIGLELCFSDEDIIDSAFSCIEDSMRSLNQTLDYQDSVPLFIEIEVGKPHSERALGVQLGVWQAAGYLKRKLHGWDTRKMPMPGICVNGHDWVAYITFENEEDNLIAMGPIEIGNTRSIPGIWQILYKLDQLFRWGEKEYKAWFEQEVMTWARKVAAGR